jgi:UDP-N-acetylmuramate dehydrogenase
MKKLKFIKCICPNTRFDVVLAPYTTFKIGGKAWAFCDVADLEELKKLVSYLNHEQIPYFVLGNGSNILVNDSGFKGVVIRLKGEFERLSNENTLIMAGAGVPISRLLSCCVKNGFSGLEFLAGIPGTVGGAVFMNAGAFGGEVSDRVEKVKLVSPSGEVLLKEKQELRFSYRKMHLSNCSIITHVWFRMDVDTREKVRERISFYLKRKMKTQPINHYSAGCIFKNPAGDYAGSLIEKAGLKGKSIGDAMISELHANFIINKGNSTASDVMALIKMVRDKVETKYGIKLNPEIKFIGFD